MSEPERKMKMSSNGLMYDYAIYPLVDGTASVLREVTPVFDFKNPAMNPQYLAMSLIETMAKNFGVGLAAPQIGLPLRAFAMGSGNTAIVCFNPEIIESTEQLDSFEEGCLSFKGLFLKIKRPEGVKVRFTDLNGKEQLQTYVGLTARIFQHELDHLNGVVMTTKVHPLNLDKAKRKVKSNLKRLAIQEAHVRKQQVIQQAIKTVVDEEKSKEISNKISINVPQQTLTLNTDNFKSLNI